MAEEAQNLVLEHLRSIRRTVEGTHAELADVKMRMTTVESSIGQVLSQIGNLQTQLAGQALRMDRIDERLARVERRLDLADA
jgi:archaellum component FlaC